MRSKRILHVVVVVVALLGPRAALTQTAPSASSQSTTTGKAQRDVAIPSQTLSTTTMSAPAGTASKASRSERAVQGTAGATATYQLQNEAANQQAAVGNYTDAVTGFEQAKGIAHVSSDAKAEAESSLNLARAIDLSRGKDGLDETRLHRLESAYRDAVQLGDVSQRAAAHNGWATTLLREGDAADAVQQLNAIDLPQVEPARRAVYRYNLAMANERLGNWEQAYNSYIAAIADKPEYQSASEAAFRLLHSRPEPHINEAVKLSETLLSKGQTASAERYTKQYLDLWAKAPGSQRLLAALLEYYAVAPLTLETLQTQEWSYLQHLAAMAGLLKRTGDLFREAGKFREALARYSAAWALAGDSEAALYAASLLHEQRQLIDSNGQLFDHLVQGIFEVKGIQYSKQDWPNILRLHTILGTIFEQEKKWGSESDSHSAIFQWRHAIDAEEQVRRADPTFPRSPMLYLKLANAYRETGHSSVALDLYLSAADAFVAASNPQQAKVAIKQVQSLNMKIAPSARERIQKLDYAIQELSSKPQA